MTYTREQLELMSGDDLNKALKIKFLDKKFTFCNSVVVDEFDFNNWNDIMPLAVEYGINVNPNAGSAYAVLQPKNQFRFCYDDIPNAQRAIACCLLMMDVK